MRETFRDNKRPMGLKQSPSFGVLYSTYYCAYNNNYSVPTLTPHRAAAGLHNIIVILLL